MSQHYDPFKEEKKAKISKDPFLDEKRTSERLQDQQLEDQEAQKPLTQDRETYSLESREPTLRRERVSPFISGGFWIRLVAFLMDTIVASAFASIFSSPIIALIGWPNNWLSVGIHGFFYFLYFILASRFTNGQSVGKIITGLRVVQKTEERLSWTTIITREFCCRLIQNAFPLLYLISAFTPRKENIGDFLCDTYVVKESLYLVEQDQKNLFYQYL